MFLEGWFLESLIQPTMAINRFTVITLNRTNVFTFCRTLLLFIPIIAVASAAATFSQYIFPCCIFIGDISIMSYMAVTIPNVYSYSKLIILSFDLFCTGISTVCYACVFMTIRNANKKVEDALKSKKRKQDTRYLVQFVFISIFYIAAWSLFYVLPYIVPADKPTFYAAVPFFITLNGSSNSIIFLSYNIEIRKYLNIKVLWQKLNGVSVSSNIPVLPFVTPP
ncbi:7TM GPCR serpentine receptor class x (Srx) domain-containing protein [Caenorhabditis elegans]|uniref:7TM GPCR serpentine receptor class x (Srx) domain-containing protein n=1 Tax=Caenorhabditis elegans TaxID=6239 RepID=O44674_CAEEL|nr:7TM GPCR serpentine receptor class x (Srx) domain-containing protein [Caenorhabditis elegans]CCD64470.1 7TM GPCR serpentine receptor class x (Srx) domain-containing protein [Caenorhabditis elegans]|eukprot:NP_503245.4 Serpentine Receptor, class X [Caenorhabditis elegans]